MVGLGGLATYFAQQITLSVLQRRHGLEPSHFVFLMRHRSHALRTRLRIFTSGVLVIGVGKTVSWVEVCLAGDMFVND
jgi:hypothetical protein